MRGHARAGAQMRVVLITRLALRARLAASCMKLVLKICMKLEFSFKNLCNLYGFRIIKEHLRVSSSVLEDILQRNLVHTLANLPERRDDG